MTELVPVAAVDGVVTPLAEARIPVMDRGFLYGDSIYEVFRTYEGVPLFFDEHWQRFENSARLIHLELGDVREPLTSDMRAAIAASGPPALGRDVYVRYIVTRGEGPLVRPWASVVVTVYVYLRPGTRSRRSTWARRWPCSETAGGVGRVVESSVQPLTVSPSSRARRGSPAPASSTR